MTELGTSCGWVWDSHGTNVGKIVFSGALVQCESRARSQ
jgi:hypothetical protein